MDLSLPTILGLAAVDAVNPCALAVLTLVLLAILTKYPKKKGMVLKVGLSFTLAVFIFYFLYGIIIIRVFQTALEAIEGVKTFLYSGLGIFALALGALNIKDYWRYGGGGFVMEVPRGWRPRMKRLVAGVTSARGAFVIGVVVTLFLLPCTIGPYIIAGGILSPIEILATVPWLLVYNLVFVSPMIGITLIIYGGYATVGKTSGWRERNIQRLHLFAGAVMVILGILLVSGLLH